MYTVIAECEDDAIRLVDPSGVPTVSSGVVEVCVSEKWSRVCHEWWDRREAEVVCQQLGFPTSGSAPLIFEAWASVSKLNVSFCRCDWLLGRSRLHWTSCVGIMWLSRAEWKQHHKGLFYGHLYMPGAQVRSCYMQLNWLVWSVWYSLYTHPDMDACLMSYSGTSE